MSEDICKLCQKTIHDDFETVGEALQESLHKLLFILNLNIVEEIVICIKCVENLQRSFNILSACIYKDRIKDSIDFNLEKCEIPSTSKSVEGSIQLLTKCYFCRKTSETENFVSLRESKENMFLVNVLEEHISEMNLIITKELLTCKSCLRSLQNILSFIMICKGEKIDKYTEIKGMDNKDQIELKDIPESILMPTSENKIEYCNLSEIGEISDEGRERYIIKTEIDIKDEDDLYNQDVGTEDIDNKPEGIDSEVLQEAAVDSGAITGFECQMCRHETNYKHVLIHHLATHEDPSEKTMFKDKVCDCETKYKSHRDKHRSTHNKTTYHCTVCTFTTKYKNNLGTHMLTHKNTSEIKMFNCQTCKYKTKYKSDLYKHMATHRDPSEKKIHRCKMCAYTTKSCAWMKKHSSTHRNPSDGTTFDRKPCECEGYKDRHELTYKNKLTVYKCAVCTYETKCKKYLISHLLIHKDASEITMFKCRVCRYATKYKQDLTRHMNTHKDASEIEMHRCGLCKYEAKQRRSLKRHMLVHGNRSKI